MRTVLFLTDALPTGFEIGILNGNTKPGDTVAVVGAGPVGLGAIMTANLCGAGRRHHRRLRREPHEQGTGAGCNR